MLRRNLSVACTALLAACSGQNPPPAAPAHRRAVVESVPAAAPQPASGPSFGEWRDRLVSLLTPADLAEVAGEPAKGAEQTVHPGLLRYRWDAGRTFVYAGARMNKKSAISLGQVRTGVRPENFSALHFARPDAQQRARHSEAIDREAKRKNLDEKSTATAHLLADAMARRQPAEAIDGIADAAAWAASATDPTLHVRLGTSTISLVVDVSDDPATNRTTALSLAHRLVERVRGSAAP